MRRSVGRVGSVGVRVGLVAALIAATLLAVVAPSSALNIVTVRVVIERVVGLDFSILVQPGASIYVLRSKITGTLSTRDAGAVGICDSTVDGSVSVLGTSRFVLIGGAGADGTAGCEGNTIGGSLLVDETTGRVEIAGNSIHGSVVLSDTDAGVAPEIESNNIGAALACLRNTPAPTDDGNANRVRGARSGQCRSL